jgi:hypothetical protein
MDEGLGRRQLTILDWHLGTKAWGAIGIRDPGSPCPDQWELNSFNHIRLFKLTRKLLAWEVRPQGWNSKELTGAFLKRWNMWFNSMIRAKPYQPRQGVAWLSSVRVVRCVVFTRNGHNPLWLLLIIKDRLFYSLFFIMYFAICLKSVLGFRGSGGWGQVVMALIGWATHVLQWYLQRVTNAWAGVNLGKSTLVPIAGCNSPCMKAESLVIVDQHATVNFLGPCTHRPSRQGSNIASKCLLSYKNFRLILW